MHKKEQMYARYVIVLGLLALMTFFLPAVQTFIMSR
jgi:hypothetical protein